MNYSKQQFLNGEPFCITSDETMKVYRMEIICNSKTIVDYYYPNKIIAHVVEIKEIGFSFFSIVLESRIEGFLSWNDLSEYQSINLS